MASTSQAQTGQIPTGQLAGNKRRAEQHPLETARDGHGKRFKGCSSLKQYTLMSKLGEGTFGEVHKAESRETGEIVAMKKIIMQYEKDGFPVTALREIKLLKMLSHPNILKLEEMVMDKPREGKKKATVYMVTPYMDHDLAGLLENPSVRFTESNLKCYMIQLLKGVAYLHKSKILHRDIKAANLLINNEGLLQIADFGLARPYDDPPPQPGRGNGEATRGYTTVVVTRWYRPPELLLQLRQYTPAIDIWGVGCVIGEMFKKRPILAGNSDLHQIQLIFDLMGSPTNENMPGWNALPGCQGVKDFKTRHSTLNTQFRDQGSLFISLLGELMKLNWHKRINAIDALEHPYFKSEPLPSKPEEIPQFQESHELDGRKFREQRANPPPAPAGGTVGMGPDGDYGSSSIQNGEPRTHERRENYHAHNAYQAKRNGYDHRPPQQAYAPRVPQNQGSVGAAPARQPAWEKQVPNGLPPRPPVDIPKEIPKGGPGFPRPREKPPSDSGRDRPPYDERSRPRGGGPPAVDTYIPSYASRDERRSRDDGYRARDDGQRRDDHGRMGDRRDDRRDDRDVRRRRSRSPDPPRDRDRERLDRDRLDRDRDRERDRNRDMYRR